MSKHKQIASFIKSQFPGKDFIPLHEPRFAGNEKKYVLDAIDSTFVSSVGAYVNRFEELMASIVGTKYAIATVNGTAALHVALLTSGVSREDEVLTQPLTFVATANAITYVGANPVFIDVDEKTMGMSATALDEFLKKNVFIRDNMPYNKATNRKIAACLPMHTFGFPCEIDKIASLCREWNIVLIEDAAESLGSYYQEQHTGSFGVIGTFSFNGNKTVTCGGGGALVTNDKRIAQLAKHLSTQAKQPHKWEFNHDMVGYNYRMPNLNAALGCAQLEQLKDFVQKKRQLAEKYSVFFESISVLFKREVTMANANYWLNTIQFETFEERNEFLKFTNKNGVMTRPVWTLMNDLPMFKSYQHDGLHVSRYLSDRLVNIPSSVQL